jgi:hypothetical protein
MYSCKLAAILIAAVAFLHSSLSAQISRDTDDKANGAAKAKQVKEKATDSGKDSGNHVFRPPLAVEAVDTPVIKFVATAHSEACSEKEGNYTYCRIKQRFTDNKDLLSGIATVIAAIGVCISIGVAMNTRSTSRRQLRAYLGISEFGYSAPYVVFTVKNYGLTPAKNVRIWCDCPDTERLSLLIAWLPKHGISNGDLLWPGDILDRKSIRVGLTEEFFVNGKISYTDAFGKPRVTTFQYAITKGPKGLRWTAHTKGNTAT